MKFRIFFQKARVLAYEKICFRHQRTRRERDRFKNESLDINGSLYVSGVESRIEKDSGMLLKHDVKDHRANTSFCLFSQSLANSSNSAVDDPLHFLGCHRKVLL